ncbi:hypothetical protein MRX96_033960 [Rhipicephalus microplus]
MLQPSWDSASKGTLSSSPTIKEQRLSQPLCGLGGVATTLSSNLLVFALQMITAAPLPRVAASCADGMQRGANGACAIILPLRNPDCPSACLPFAGGTHIDTLLLDAPAIMGF